MQNDSWPNDADGDVFRRLSSSGVDFSQSFTIDFNIDFDRWPPPERAIEAIKGVFPVATLHEVDGGGYVLFRIQSLLTYELVMETQAHASALVANDGGRCESWGVMH